MNTEREKTGAELFRGVLLVHLILAMHLVLLALIGLLVIFFGGIARYWLWILLGGLALAASSGYWIYRRAKSQGRNLFREARNSAVVPGGTLEVSFLGGLASVKIGRPDPSSLPPLAPPRPQALLEAPETLRLRELASLVEMYEKNLITREEFEKAKGAIFNPSPRPAFGAGSLEQ
jgi:hypothetical protein